MRSQQRRGSCLAPAVTAIGGARHGGSIAGKGGHAEPARKNKSESPGPLGQVTPRLSCVGGHRLAHGLAQHGTFGPVVAPLTQAVEAPKHTHPGDNVALWHHRASTRLRRLQALFFAPRCGLDRRTAFDTHEHALQTLRGRG